MNTTSTICPCDTFVHPQLISNPPGRSTIAYRVGDYLSFREALLRGRPGEVELLNWRPGAAYLANLAGDPCLVTDIGAKCWIVDDQTVAKTNGTGTRSPAGIIEDVDANGVWVRFDEALNRAY